MTGNLAPPVKLPTAEEALANAVRLLIAAEDDTDRQLMERYEGLADSWIAVSGVLYATRHTCE